LQKIIKPWLLMKKIDRYILVKFLTTFFFCLVLFTAIVVVVDISEKTDDFVKTGLSFKRILVDYYFGFIPRIDAMLFPLFVFISVIFFTSKMAGRSEVIAILSSGVSFKRYLLPFFVGGLFLAGLLWLGYQYVVPNANKKWGDFQTNYLDRNSAIAQAGQNAGTYKQKIYFRLDSNAYVGIRGYDTINKIGNVFFINRFKGKNLVYNLRAESFSWDTAVKKWKLSNVTEKKIDSINEKITRTTTLYQNYNFTPRDLRKNEYLKDQLITPDLNDLIKLEKQRGTEGINSLLVERYNRDAIPVSVIILTFIGAILASKKVRGGSGLHLAVGVLLSVAYILFSRFSIVFATKGDFPAILAAWIPNILFTLVAFYLYKRAPK
jgi:lipopolysaccharide export system permease protein